MDISYYKKYEPVFGSWHIVREIGEGSFGKVFEIERQDFGHTYKAALKAVTIPRSKNEIKTAISDGVDEESVTAYFEGIVEEMVNEFALMSRIKGNSNIVSYEDHVVIKHDTELGWDILIRMELLTPLVDHAIAKPLSRTDVVKLGIDICKALEACRANKIIHRDIKPENIFISALGDYKLGDFGIAKTVEKTTGASTKTGTLSYMAPEVYLGNKYGSSVDIYSLGVVLYRYMNNFRAPFSPPYPERITHAAQEEAMTKRMNGVPLPNPVNADPGLAEIILKACAFNPQNRYSSPTEMRTALESLGENSADSLSTSKSKTAYMSETKVLNTAEQPAKDNTVSVLESANENDNSSEVAMKTDSNLKHKMKMSAVQENTEVILTSERITIEDAKHKSTENEYAWQKETDHEHINTYNKNKTKTKTINNDSDIPQNKSNSFQNTSPNRKPYFALLFIVLGLLAVLTIILINTRDKGYKNTDIPEDAFQYGGHYYYIYTSTDEIDSWEKAREFCLRKGGYLATLTTAEENEAVYNEMLRRGYEDSYFGLYETLDGAWHWTSNEEFRYCNWAEGEPNSDDEPYARFVASQGYGLWNDDNFIDHTEVCSYICEWGKPTEKITTVENAEMYIPVATELNAVPCEYTISSNEKSVGINQEFCISVVPNGDYLNISVRGVNPSGETKTYDLGQDTDVAIRIDDPNQAGKWKFYADISDENGTYVGMKYTVVTIRT